VTLCPIGRFWGGALTEGNQELAVRLALERTGSSFAHCIALFDISRGEMERDTGAPPPTECWNDS
jgi:hypothetical protein